MEETFLLSPISFVTKELFPYSCKYLSTGTTLIIIVLLLLKLRSTRIYLVDFTCYRPPSRLRVPKAHFIEHVKISNINGIEGIDFQVKIWERSGIGSNSSMPDALHEIPPSECIDDTRNEVEMVLFTVVEDLLSKHKIHPKSIDILVSNCSIFCSTPSISSMIINRFGFRSDVKSFNLSGMGCSAGILSICLAKDLLIVYKNSLVLVLSMEAVTPNGYAGKEKSMLLPNVLFRMGGAAVLLSNRKQDKSMAKYELQHLVRTHIGSDDEAYGSVFHRADEDGWEGVSLSRTLLSVATKALKTNISTLGPFVLPYYEQLRFAGSVIRKKISFLPKQKGVYVPNFNKAIQHYCIHAGGKAVIDGIQHNLKLQNEDAEASRMTLHRFGNTSSSSIWYELSYLEAKGKMKKGNNVWQIAFGSGFKCNSAVWKCVSHVDPTKRNAWSDCINLYPIIDDEIPTVRNFQYKVSPFFI